ncbi:hypothetical protein WJ0W_001727 [Paenibacillus melissococcoides]|uniref:Uncharacterized protein n=1 Tax=Paenibacillus melissococcoides TaxID=2912268 RepID=A0ABN8U0Q3_9BACL|nr:hypothetical protein WJ0W_001727 [Paenibacillus melissococcoides]
MSPHPEELLHIYIILGPFAPSRSETGEIAAVLQDSLSTEVVHIELLYLSRLLLTESACLKKSCGFQAVGTPFFTKGWRLSIYRIKTWHSDQSVLNPFFLLRDESKWSAEKSLGLSY